MNPYFEAAGIKLYHGDCRDIKVESDLIVTDPPYGQEFVSGRAGGQWGMLIGDDDKEGVEAALAYALKDLRENRKCVDGCGIAEVKVVGVRVIQEAQ
jgi:DNA modification methylase